MQKPDPFTDFLIELAAGLTQRLIEASARRVQRTFVGGERQQALQAAIAEGLARALKGFSLSEDERDHLDTILTDFFQRSDVVDELAQLLEPRPENNLDLSMLRGEFRSAGYNPKILPHISFDKFMNRFLKAYYNAAAYQTALQDVIKINLLGELVERTDALLEIQEHEAKTMESVENAVTRLAGSPETLLHAYYQSLGIECSYLPLGVIDARFVKTSGEVPLPLSDVYVDLDVINPPAPEKGQTERDWALSFQKQEQRERTALIEALLQPANRYTVLLGDAGSGKTTFINFLTFLLTSDFLQEKQQLTTPDLLRGRLVVRLVLRKTMTRYTPTGERHGNAQMLWNALRDDIADHLDDEAGKQLLTYLQGRLLKEGGVILLDGLDEVPEAQNRRAALLEAVRDLAALLPKQKTYFLITARPYAYADKAWHLPGFSSLALAAFNDKQIEHFIERFYQAVSPSMGWRDAESNFRATRLLDAINERDYLAKLASRPLLLTLMATLHSSWGQLPEDRADLYEETIRLLLSRWQLARQSIGPDGKPYVEPGILQALNVGEERLLGALEALAFHTHEFQGKGDQRDESPADISKGEVLLAFEPLLESCGPEKLLFYLKDCAGLLVEKREGLFAFPHRSFQEYLAACYLANRPDFALELKNRVCNDPAWWREVCLLGIGKARKGGLSQATGVVNILIPSITAQC